MGKAWLAVALVAGLVLLPGCGEPETAAPETPEATPAAAEPAPPPTPPATSGSAPAPAATPKPPTAPETSTPPVAPPPTSGTVPESEVATAPVPPPQPPVAPGLDLEGLERRLKETSALGFMTKLALKNEIDDLLDDVGRFHHKQKGDLPSLRERFDLLVLKLTSMLQDAEPALASEIADAREGLWRLLADPVEFDKLSA